MKKSLSNANAHRWMRAWLIASAVALGLTLAGCAATSPSQFTATPPLGPSAKDLANQQQIERAQRNLEEGQRLYDAGSYKNSLQSWLEALDSGVLTVPQQLLARKHMAFIYCVTNRVRLCKEQFEKAVAISDRFDLLPTEAGHPMWGSIFLAEKAKQKSASAGR